MAEDIARFYESEDRVLTLIETFSGIAIFIGCLGLFGLISFMVVQKTKEIGIRKILGGDITHILWIFGKEFLRLVLIAFFIAAPIGWWLMNYWLQNYKYRIHINAWTFIAAFTVSAIIIAITVGIQAMKASLMNPVKSLRSE